MKTRANINIEMANHLNNLSDDDISVIGNSNVIKNHDDIGHIIIGRWYYGLFLLAKDKLINTHSFIKNCSKQDTCHYAIKLSGSACNADCFKHKTRYKIDRDGKYYPAGKSIWLHISQQYSTKTRKLKAIERLVKMREEFEYNGCICTDSDIRKAKKLFEGVINVLK